MLFGFPLDVWVVMSVEFTERLGYYGTAFMLMTYCTGMLRWPQSVANAVINAIYTLTPVAACVSSGLSDGIWGRRFSLVVFLSLYAVGISLVALSSFPFMYDDFPHSPSMASIILFLLGLLLFASGYGGMKVCTNPLMADSVSDARYDNEEKRAEVLSRLFRWVYWVTNCGALVGISISPFLRGIDERRTSVGSTTYTTGYYFGFSVSAASCALGVLVMVLMYRIFNQNKPAPSFLLGRILWTSIRIRWYFAAGHIRDDVFLRAHRWDLLDYAAYPFNTEVYPLNMRCGVLEGQEVVPPLAPSDSCLLEPLATSREGENGRSSVRHESLVQENMRQGELKGAGDNPPVFDVSTLFLVETITRPLSLNLVEDGKKVAIVCRAFIALPVYWLVTNQFSTNLVLQAAALNLPDYIPPEVFNNVNSLALLVSIALLDRVIFPCMFRGRPPPMRGRAVSGFLIMIASMMWCGFLQIEIDKRGTYDDEGQYILNTGTEKLSALLLLTPYIMQGVASALVDTTVMEVAYVRAPKSMKGAVMALYFVASSLSGFLGLVLSPVMKPQNIMVIIFSLGGALLIVTIIFYVLNRPDATTSTGVVLESSNQDYDKEQSSVGYSGCGNR